MVSMSRRPSLRTAVEMRDDREDAASLGEACDSPSSPSDSRLIKVAISRARSPRERALPRRRVSLSRLFADNYVPRSATALWVFITVAFSHSSCAVLTNIEDLQAYEMVTSQNHHGTEVLYSCMIIPSTAKDHQRVPTTVTIIWAILQSPFRW